MTLASVERYRPGAVSTVGDHAVVVGGSVAGLLSARVLSDAFERVTVVERDPAPVTDPDDAEPRRGVPQGAQIHGLQEAGRATFEDLFPGYGEALIEAGGLMLDATTDLQFYAERGFLADGTARMPGYSATRPLFEAVLRSRVAAVPSVDLQYGRQVTGYLTDDGSTVEGVSLRAGSGETRLAADLVVDATGRASRTPQWLAENGYGRPSVDEVEVDVAYATVPVRRRSGERSAVLQPASHPHTRGCAVFPVEDDRWLVNLHGVHGDHPPSDSGELVAFAETLPVSHAARLLSEREWLSPPDRYPFPSNRRHRYEALDSFPAGLVVLGDAIASFNPIYGQGMSVAALETLELHHALAAGGRRNLGRRFFDRASAVVDVAWSMAVGSDHQFPETTGPRPRGSGLFSAYFDRVLRAAQEDPRLRDELMRVIGIERPPTHLLRPRVAARVLARSLGRSGLAGRPDPAAPDPPPADAEASEATSG